MYCKPTVSCFRLSVGYTNNWPITLQKKKKKMTLAHNVLLPIRKGLPIKNALAKNSIANPPNPHPPQQHSYPPCGWKKKKKTARSEALKTAQRLEVRFLAAYHSAGLCVGGTEEESGRRPERDKGLCSLECHTNKAQLDIEVQGCKVRNDRSKGRIDRKSPDKKEGIWGKSQRWNQRWLLCTLWNVT